MKCNMNRKVFKIKYKGSCLKDKRLLLYSFLCRLMVYVKYVKYKLYQGKQTIIKPRYVYLGNNKRIGLNLVYCILDIFTYSVKIINS